MLWSQSSFCLSALLGICGACLERACCVLLFAILYLLHTLSSILSVIVGLATWDYDGEVTITDDDKEEKVVVDGDAYIGLVVGCSVVILAIQVYFATCLFSLYYQLKNKEEAQKRDAEMAFVGKNTP